MPTPYTFTPAQQAEITRLYDQAFIDAALGGAAAVGAYAPMYEYIASVAEAAEQGDDDPVRLTRVWFDGAMGVNSDEGAFSSIIRLYNIRQGELRYGTTFSDVKLQEASNEVGRLVYLQIFESGWTLPTVEEIGIADLNGVRDTLYEADAGEGEELNLNQAWPGIMMLGKLGGDFTGRLLQLHENDLVELDTLGDIKNVLYAWESFRYAFEATGITDITALDAAVAWDIRDLSDITALGSPREWFNLLVGVQDPVAAIPLELVSKVGSEGILDMLQGAHLGKPMLGSTTEANFETNAKAFFDSKAEQLQSLQVELMPTDAAAMVSKAKTDVNARAALVALSSISVTIAR